MEDQHLPADASSTALSPGYIADFDSEEDEEEPEKDHAVTLPFLHIAAEANLGYYFKGTTVII
ncbi:hypothetical protein Tco_0547186, partial [Tanacetum coccineum]